jgi:hypothetical protein
MSHHKVYFSIVEAVKDGKLIEPFGVNNFRSACPGFGPGTYNAFLYKHRLGNGKQTELFIKVGEGKFELIRPLKYGLDAR